MKKLILALILLQTTSATAYYNHRPIHRYNYHRTIHYGGPNYYRQNWTHYLVPDTSHGYRTYRPRAHNFGLNPHHQQNTNPRSLYR